MSRLGEIDVQRKDRIRYGLLGAFVADAAALGFHWLYDPERIAELADGTAAFRDPDPEDFVDAEGVFVHGGKVAGDLSQYGEQLRLATVSMSTTSAVFDVGDYQDRFRDFFGPGGGWVGYIDEATRGTLESLKADRRNPSGVDDDQLPAVSRLPAVLANRSMMAGDIEAAITVTNDSAVAIEWSNPVSSLIRDCYEGKEPAESARRISEMIEGDIGDALRQAVSDDTTDDTVSFAGEVGRACPLPQAVPVIFHICARASSFRDAVERNIRAGGDSCGRAIVLGSVFGARYNVEPGGVPLGWIARLSNGRELIDTIEDLIDSAE